MVNAQELSIIATACVLGILIFQRRFVFSWSAIGVFWTTNLIFVFVGVLAIPWLQPLLGHGVFFEDMDFSQITETDIQWSIILTVGGGMAVLFFYRLANVMFTDGKPRPRPPSLLAPVKITAHGFLTSRLLFVSVLALLYAGAIVLLNLPEFISGFRLGFLGGDPEEVIIARRASGSNYLFTLLVYNAIPFLGVALWLRFYREKNRIFKYYAYFYNFCAIVLLTFTFEKRPLLVFIISLILARLLMQGTLNPTPKAQISNKKKRIKLFRKVLLYGGLLYGILMILYFAHLSVGRSDESFGETIIELSTLLIIRVFGRLAIEPAMFVNYFPAVEPFYGFKSMGLISSIFGLAPYSSTGVIFEYYSRVFQEGNVAAAALIDFYGAFGMIGWLFGTVLLGFMLYWLDAFLARREPNVVNAVLKIFSIVFVYYLSQASLNGSLLGYGGGIFLFLWFIIKAPSRSGNLQ
jgi:hypothetical protein